MKSKQTILIPKNSEKAPLRKYVQAAIAAQKRRFEQRCKLLREEAKLMRPQFPLSDKEKKDMNKAYRRHFPPHSRKKSPPFKPLISHNPSVYVPFDFSSSFYNDSGISPYGSGLYLKGPNPQTGQIGAYLDNLGDPSELFSTDILAAHSSVGFLYFAQASGTLHISAQAMYCGRAGSANSNVYAGLELSANHFISPNQHLHTVADIYRSHVFAWTNLENARALAFSFGNFPEWEGKTLSLFRPVRKFHWYVISVSASQHALGSSGCDFDIYAGPIHYELV